MRTVFGAAMTVAALACLQACTTFDPLDQRGETINRDATDYANNAELMNVVRASLSEPLTFLTITGVSGTASAQAALGLPSIALGPHGTTPRDFVFGSNSLTRQNSNTFQASVVDDPGSYTALLAPVNPALIAFFEHQGYAREELFFLFVDEIRQVTRDSSGKVTSVIQDFRAPSDPSKPEMLAFAAQLATLLDAGLTSRIDISTTPTGRALPPSKFCIDPLSSASTFRVETKTKEGAKQFPQIVDIDHSKLTTDACDADPWLSSKAADTSSDKANAGSDDKTASYPQVLASSDKRVWLKFKDGHIVHLDLVNGDWKESDPLPLKEKPDTPEKAPPKPLPMVGYPLDVNYQGKPQAVQYQLFLRSTFGAYSFLGAILHQRVKLKDDPAAKGRPQMDIRPFASDDANYTGLLNLEFHDSGQSQPDGDCFAKIDYREITYCVPQNATRTKRLFTLLHQLQQLNTAPSNAPTTLTVTAVH